MRMFIFTTQRVISDISDASFPRDFTFSFTYLLLQHLYKCGKYIQYFSIVEEKVIFLEKGLASEILEMLSNTYIFQYLPVEAKSDVRGPEKQVLFIFKIILRPDFFQSSSTLFSN